jgi:hypothetical protein
MFSAILWCCITNDRFFIYEDSERTAEWTDEMNFQSDATWKTADISETWE